MLQGGVINQRPLLPEDEEPLKQPRNIMLLEEYREDCRLRGMVQGSNHSYTSSVRIFLKFLEKNSAMLESVDVPLLKKYIDYLTTERGDEYPTLKSHFSALSALFDWLILEDKLPIKSNLIPGFRKRYLRRYKGGKGYERGERQLISVVDMARLINSIPVIRDQAIVLMLAKTGVRRAELISLDIEDINFDRMSIRLKRTAKRSNRLVFFDEETKRVVLAWLRMRESFARPDCLALFITESGGRVNKNHIYDIVTRHAERIGLHDPTSKKLEERFTPHCCRHWFTTHLRRNGMLREHVQELRGDSRLEAIDGYNHIDPELLRIDYLAHMPRLGIR